MLLLTWAQLMAKVIDLGLAGSFYLTRILCLVGLLELLNLRLHCYKLVLGFSQLFCLGYRLLLCGQLGGEVGFFPLEGFELESCLRVFIFLLVLRFFILNGLCILVGQCSLVLLLGRRLPLDLHTCSGGLSSGLLRGDNS